jgi:hypothetical protein
MTVAVKTSFSSEAAILVDDSDKTIQHCMTCGSGLRLHASVAFCRSVSVV